MDDKGRRVKEAGPSTPVEILGLSDVPNAGEILVQTDNDKEAKNFAATFVAENKKNLLEETKAKMSLDDLFNQIQEGNLKELALVVKADVQGSVEAVKQSLVKLSKRGSCRTRHPRRCRCDQRVRRYAGNRIFRHHYRI